MPQSSESKSLNLLNSQSGQAAIFVALMFNVLFVFFAMAINVALVVHDKINLQNSVDLAAYYAASKQAEMLNAIAHENYAIRQSYKLLAWRYRTLGTMGLYKDVNNVHPVWTGETSDVPFGPAVKPSVCIVYKPTWNEVPPNENLCNIENLRIPALPEVKVIAGFLGINFGISELSKQLRTKFDIQCQKEGAYNWWWAMSILTAFRFDQRNRKQMIYALAGQLSKQSSNGDFLDLDGNSVYQGALATFRKNLTFTNRQSFESGNGEFQLFNSLAGVDPTKWLVEIKTVPTIIYTDVDNSNGCAASPQPVQNLPQSAGARQILLGPAPDGLSAGNLVQWKNESFLTDSDFQFSIGVEKNPWYMAYVGAKATTNPRQIFFPFGSGVETTARGFAKPFGGRMGPWYQSKWEHGDGNSSGNLVDPLMAPRVVAGGLLNSPDDPRRLPNYSRYPGDQLGMMSKLSLNALPGLRNLTANLDFYKNIKADLTPNDSGDILAWDGPGNSAPELRNLEIAAIAPDLFDATYYSIDADFTKNYYSRIKQNASAFGVPNDAGVRSDLGNNGQTIPAFSIQEQLAIASSRQRSEAYYFIRNKFHLLTAWLPAPGAFLYDVNAALANFGKCQLSDDGFQHSNPGSCVAGGGRVGYSVKLISRDALNSDKHAIGGQGSAPGKILNPPGRGW